MADYTEYTSYNPSKLGNGTTPTVKIASVVAVGATTMQVTSPGFVKSDGTTLLTTPFFVGVRNQALGYTEQIKVTSLSSATTADAIVKGIPPGKDASASDSDYDTQLPIGSVVEIIPTDIVQSMVDDVFLGNIPTGANNFIIGDNTNTNNTFSVKDATSTKGLFRRNHTSGKAEYSNDGTVFIEMDAPAITSVVPSQETSATAGNGELYRDTDDSDSLVFKDSGGTSVKLYDDTTQLVPQASVELISDITTTAALINESGAFFTATDATGAEMETLTDGSNADSLHIHSYNNLLYNLTTPVTVSNTVTETTIATFTVPANTFGTSNLIQFVLNISDLDFERTEYVTIKVKYGSTTILTTSTFTADFGSSQTNSYGRIFGEISANGTTSSQRASLSRDLYSATSTFANWSSGNLPTQGAATEDSTGALDITVTATWNATGTGNSITFNGAYFNLVQS